MSRKTIIRGLSKSILPNYCSHTRVMSNNYIVPNIKSAIAQKFLMFDPSTVNYFGLNYFYLNNSM